MLPTNEEIRKENHEYLAAIFEETNPALRREKVIKLLGNEEDFDVLEAFFNDAFDETDGKKLAILHYFCAQHRVSCTQIPAYMDFIPKFYTCAEDLKKF